MVKSTTIFKMLALGVIMALRPGCSDTHFEGAGKLITRALAPIVLEHHIAPGL